MQKSAAAIAKRKALRQHLAIPRNETQQRLSYAQWVAQGKHPALPVSLGKILSRGNRVAGELHRWLQHHGNRRNARLSLSIEDTIRLSNIRVWAQRHYLDTKEVIGLIMPIILSRSQQGGNNYGLGISVRAMTGEAALRILTEEITKLYPNDEHIGLWREKQRRLIVARETDHVASAPWNGAPMMSSLKTYIENYRTQLTRTHKRSAGFVSPTHNYRWNPWR